MTVKALLMPCGIISPERVFNELLISLLYMLIWRSNTLTTEDKNDECQAKNVQS